MKNEFYPGEITAPALTGRALRHGLVLHPHLNNLQFKFHRWTWWSISDDDTGGTVDLPQSTPILALKSWRRNARQIVREQGMSIGDYLAMKRAEFWNCALLMQHSCPTDLPPIFLE